AGADLVLGRTFLRAGRATLHHRTGSLCVDLNESRRFRALPPCAGGDDSGRSRPADLAHAAGIGHALEGEKACGGDVSRAAAGYVFDGPSSSRQPSGRWPGAARTQRERTTMRLRLSIAAAALAALWAPAACNASSFGLTYSRQCTSCGFCVRPYNAFSSVTCGVANLDYGQGCCGWGCNKGFAGLNPKYGGGWGGGCGWGGSGRGGPGWGLGPRSVRGEQRLLLVRPRGAPCRA